MINILEIIVAVSVGFPSAKVKLLDGDIQGAILQPFIETMGFWFYALMLGTMAISIYLKSGSITMPLTIGFLILGVAINMLPEQVVGAAYVISSIGMAGILYKVFKG